MKTAQIAHNFRYLLMILWLGAPASAQGEATAAPAILTYPASFFAGAELTTAYDMVGRLPGFIFDSGRSARGYSGTAGNVLVDGKRPTGKTDSLTTILQRIAVTAVERIDVIRGGAPGIDMQGQPVVANVVLKRQDSRALIVTLQNQFYGSGKDTVYGSVEFSRKKADRAYDLTLTRYDDSGDDFIGDGNESIITPGQPTVVEGAKREDPDRPGWGVNGSAAFALLGGSFGTSLTMRATTHNESVIYDPPMPSLSFDGEKYRAAELGLHWDGAIGPLEINLVGLQRFNRQLSLETSDSPGSDQLFNEVRDTGESILRGTARYRPNVGLTLETGLEGAYNSLDGLSTDSLNGVPQSVVGADAQVHELRSDGFAQATWNISQDWSLEAGSHAEYSAIAADGVPARDFAFLKPRLLLSWSPRDDNQFRLRIERVIGQLDFNNFVASASLTFNGISAGNINLRPDQRWQFEGDYELHFWDKGALMFSALHEDITDLVDYVPLGNGQDGPGNIAKAVNNQFDLELSVPLDHAGIGGGQFKSSLLWRDGAVADPVTGATRGISNARDRVLTFSYLQDMPGLKSSFELDVMPSGFIQPAYRITQIITFRLRSAVLNASWDYKPAPDLDVLFQAFSFTSYRGEYEQDDYAGPRNDSGISQIDDLRIVAEPRFLLQLRKTF